MLSIVVSVKYTKNVVIKEATIPIAVTSSGKYIASVV